MEFSRLFKIKHIDGSSSRLFLGSDPPLVFDLPGVKTLRVLSRSFFLAFLVISFLLFGYLTGGFWSSHGTRTELMSIELVETVFREVSDGGLVATYGSILVVGEVTHTQKFYNGGKNGVNLVKEGDLRRLASSPDAVFVFMVAGATVLIVDRVLKVGGVVAFKLEHGEELNSFMKFRNYRIVYVKTFEYTVVAMKKMGKMERLFTSQRRISLCGRGGVKGGLEGALMEAPRGMVENWNGGSKSVRFVSDMMGDDFGAYPRRVFVNMVMNGGVEEDGVKWFEKRYPKRGQAFDLYEVRMEKEGGISEWLRSRVREEEFVVVKAEAEVVEEMLNGGGICLVDELFMECGRSDGEVELGKKMKNNKKGMAMGRAYWECLALFGRLRDEGVAVHQWWTDWSD